MAQSANFLLCKHLDLSLTPRTQAEKCQACNHSFGGLVDSRGFLASQPNLFGNFQANERLSQKER